MSLFQECRVRYLLNLILRLPRASLTQEAMSLDLDLVTDLEARRADDEPSRHAPRWSEFDPTVESLYDVIDRLGDVANASIAAAGGKPKQVKPLKRPETALTIARRKREEATHDRLKAMLLPAG